MFVFWCVVWLVGYGLVPIAVVLGGTNEFHEWNFGFDGMEGPMCISGSFGWESLQNILAW